MTTLKHSFTDNPEAQMALRCIEHTSMNVFLTGKAGSGKTTLLKQIIANTHKRCLVAAPTGVAAINAGGVTLHSLFQLPFGPFVPGHGLSKEFNMRGDKQKILKSLDLLIIDEVSMVRADLLDSVDSVLRHVRKSSVPFGGVQLLLIGDLQQLPPVIKDDEWALLRNYYQTFYFFGSTALQNTQFTTIELKHIYRQADQQFVDLLNAVRMNKLTPEMLEMLNSRYMPDGTYDDNGCIRLTSHNHLADKVNNEKLKSINADEVSYGCVVEGVFPETSYPAERELVLKKGAQVMFLKNDKEKGIFNGKLGTVVSANKDNVDVEIEGGITVNVEYEEWTNAKYVIDKESQEIKEEVEGKFKQIPLRLAWAITIHKSQGLTFDKCIVDAGVSFAHGQVYVALSRCRSMKGLILSSKIGQNAVMSDQRVTSFMDEQEQNKLDEQALANVEQGYVKQLVHEMLSYKEIFYKAFPLKRVFEQDLYKAFPEETSRITALVDMAYEKLSNIADGFTGQTLQSPIDDVYLGRVKKGAQYMLDRQAETLDEVMKSSDVAPRNKEVAKRLKDLRAELTEMLAVKRGTMKQVIAEGFDSEAYLRAKNMAVLSQIKDEKPKRGVVGFEIPANIKKQMPATVSDSNQRLFVELYKLRAKIIGELFDEGGSAVGGPVNTGLGKIATLRPETMQQLANLKVMKTPYLKEYGARYLEAVEAAKRKGY